MAICCGGGETTFTCIDDINRKKIEFFACKSKTIKVIGNSTIKRGAFLDCKNLETLYLPDTFKMENNQEFSLTADLFKPENAQKLQEVREYLGLNEKVNICCSSKEKQTSTTPSKTKEKV